MTNSKNNTTPKAKPKTSTSSKALANTNPKTNTKIERVSKPKKTDTKRKASAKKPVPTLFIDRDGTLIDEPKTDFQIDSLDKLNFEADVFIALKTLSNHYRLVMVSNQDGLGTQSFPKESFDVPHEMMLRIFASQGIVFDKILICPHTPEDNCDCRKPKVALLQDEIDNQSFDVADSYVIGDRQTDVLLAQNLGIKALQYHPKTLNWQMIVNQLSSKHAQRHTAQRHAKVVRTTKETDISVEVWLDETGGSQINTGVGFFDHMLDQIATHGGFRMNVSCQGDLHIDEHHTVEDVALALGQALKEAIGDKKGIARFGFVLPMDECKAQCTMDLSGRPYLKFKAKFRQDKVGDLSCEMVEHFFYSLSYTMMATIHLSVKGKNTHHQVEGLFKAFGRTLRQAIRIESNELPSSKGVL